MSERIILEQGSLQGLEFELKDQAEWTLGSDPEFANLLVDDPDVSLRQALLQKTDEGIVLSNLSEESPTLVNGQEAKEPLLLKEGDTFTIGNQTFRFYSQSPAESEEEDEDYKDEDSLDDTPPEDFELTPTDKPANEELGPAPSLVDSEETLPSVSPTEQELLETEQRIDVTDSPPEEIDSIYDEKKNLSLPNNGLAEINFDLLDAGRYLLKVMSGPNNGAEFSMEVGQSYLIGTDPNSCDIVFHDTSVSRQHARINVTEDETIMIEDLKSRNGTLLDGKAIEQKTELSTSSVVTVGTTSFVVYDREGNMQTIISPLLPEIVKVLQRDDEKQEESTKEPEPQALSTPAPQKEKPIGAFIAIAMITGLFVLMVIGTTTLFKAEPVELIDNSGADASLKKAIEPFSNVKFSFNKSTGRLLLVGHVLTLSDKNQLLYNLQGMKYINNIDDTGVVIDELVWRNFNEILNRNPEWKGITIQSPVAGKFVLTGYLQTRKQAENLYNYLASSFPYLDRLDRALVVDEELVQSVTNMLANKDIRSVNVQFSNGDLILTGGVPASRQDAYLELQTEFKKIPGIRQVRSQVSNLVTDRSTLNVSDRYEVSGYSKQGNLINVVINGRIVTRGDTLDGMTIRSIAPNTILLEKDGVNYRIDYNR